VLSSHSLADDLGVLVYENEGLLASGVDAALAHSEEVSGLA